jgi:hydrogenase expression/formation protein HypD
VGPPVEKMETERKTEDAARRLSKFRPARPLRIMEVCGTHTVAIRRAGIQQLLPAGVRLVSGPGCPVCVTPDSYIDEAVFLARQGFIVATFGDMVRVPGSDTSLQREKADGADVRIVYSPLDALAIAGQTPGEVVFLAVGFETTVPGIAVAVQQALRNRQGNLSFLVGNRLVPPALAAIMTDDSNIDGFLLPGHVSAIIGRDGYRAFARRGLPGVITGFTPEEILSSLLILMEMIAENRSGVVNNYPRVVRDEGNQKSRSLIGEVFEAEDADWRGLGRIRLSGLRLKEAYAGLDIRRRIDIELKKKTPDSRCRCGEVLQGRIDPPACPLFGSSCTPERPLGPCMVSSEGSCGAWHAYG